MSAIQENPAEPVIGDSDSDLDIDTQEFGDSFESRGSRDAGYMRGSSPRARNGASKERGFGRIALRNLRTRGQEAFSRDAEGRRQPSGTAQDDDDDARQGLLDEGAQEHDSLGHGPGTPRDQDEVPLVKSVPGPAKHRTGFFSRFRSGGTPSTPISNSAGHVGGPDEDALDTADPAAARTIYVGRPLRAKHPPNAVSNARYNAWTFLPVTLYNEFSFFLNLYFLLVALSQIVPALRIGFLSTYVAPLVFVLAVTLGKEAVDDLARRRRDAEANAEGYTVLEFAENIDENGGASKRRRSSRSVKSRKASTVGLNARNEGAPLNSHPNENGSADHSVQEVVLKSRDIRVGDVLKLRKGQRVPADVVILGSYVNEPAAAASDHSVDMTTVGPELVEHSTDDLIQSTVVVDAAQAQHQTNNNDSTVGETFIRTEQLDGETDWKLRLASSLTQKLDVKDLTKVQIVAGKPERNVNKFVGTVRVGSDSDTYTDRQESGTVGPSNGADNDAMQSMPLTIDNTAWANTVLASNSITLAAVIYTGPQTRQAMSTSRSRSKTGLLEHELNALTKILCLLTLLLSVTLVALERIEDTGSRKWYIAIPRFIILFSTIIPISLRVNLDMGKTVYSRFIEKDEGLPGAIVRTSTIPEELGRIEYLLSDKTGTLTQNEMDLKKIHVGTVSYANEAMDEVATYVRQAFGGTAVESGTTTLSPSAGHAPSHSISVTRTRREISSRVRDVVLALALCHNVTPTIEEKDGKMITSYQASSPDEIAIVRWVESVGLRLSHRDRKSIVLQSTHTGQVVIRVRILELFPFTSETKRMAIIAQFVEGSEADSKDGEIWFYQKGADTVMGSIVAANDWLEEETSNMAREGLRTLVVGRKKLSSARYAQFASSYREASLSLRGRDRGMAAVVKDHLEQSLELLGVTGVEDKLQRDVKPSIELLRNAGVRIWMLTGDKVETARCVAVSARLITRGQYVHTIAQLKRKDAAQDSLDLLNSKLDASLVIDGESLSLLMTHYRDAFTSIAVQLPTVIACRCSPTQKADVAQLIRLQTKKRVCCIGDGGNDVSMIQAADVGVGIVGKEGHQASLAADFSIEQFCHLPKLLVWHGRNSYKRSAKLAQFVIHRGLIISVCQTMFSIASRFEPIALYKNWLLVGYATVYTMAPVFSLVLDRDVDEGLAKLYPELYKELTEGRSLSYRTFFVWLLVSIYQGCLIQGLSQILVAVHGPRMVSVSFTVLVINELVMVAFEITTWHPLMILSLLGTAAVYFISIPFLGDYFDLGYVLTVGFLWRVLAISAISLVPPYVLKIARRTWKPPSYRKVRGV